MQSAFVRCKLLGKDLGSWLILLGYIVIVVGSVTIIQDWVSKNIIPEPIGVFPTSVQGFVPLLDSLESPSRSIGVQGGSFFQEVYASSLGRLTSQAPWEKGIAREGDFSRLESEEQSAGFNLQYWLPDRLAIPAIQIDVPIEETDFEDVEIEGIVYRQWLAPDARTVGWQPSSASLGIHGNTVLVGHHNIDGEVFRDLEKLEVGDQITVYSGEKVFEYRVQLKVILPEKHASIETRLENARWIQTTQDERITLVTCWPYETNTHRLILVAGPVDWGSMGMWENYQIDP